MTVDAERPKGAEPRCTERRRPQAFPSTPPRALPASSKKPRPRSVGLRRRGRRRGGLGRRGLGRGRGNLRARRRARARALPSPSRARRRSARPRISASSWLGALGARTVEEPITDALEGLGCYRRRDEAIRRVFPDYEPSWRHKLVRSAPTGGIIFFSLVVERPDGTEEPRRMPPDAYRELISATNMKQRVRKLLEYTWADRLGYAVIGTPNLLEYDQGFFVKGGDGLADVKPIARLYKSQVYAARPRARAARGDRHPRPDDRDFQPAADAGGVLLRPPVRPHGPAACGGTHTSVEPRELSGRVGLEPEDVEAAYREIERRRVATEYLHAPAILLDPAD